MADSFLNEVTRAEDILLGALGFDGDAAIIALSITEDGYHGEGQWPDGDTFTFESEWEPDDLEKWALSIIERKLNEQLQKTGTG